MRLVHGLRFDNIRGDIHGGLTAAVVALPLALGFGVASGAGPVAGLYGAIFVGLFAALLAADEYGVLVLDLTDVPMIDSSAAMAVEDAVRQAHAHHKPVYLVGARAYVEGVLRRLGVIGMIGEGHRHATRIEALRHAVHDIEESVTV